MQTIIANACHGGKVAILGIFPERFAIDWDKVIFSMLTIRGIYGREMYETWYKMTTMIQSGLDIAPVITHRLPYTAFAEGFAAMQSGEAGKVVLDWEVG
jgi:threonine 3-dehydrogenase